MNFQNLGYFVIAARELNLTKAAAELHISQQALSNHIIKLEQELDCQLFDRRHGLQLTYSGKQLKRSAEQILDIQRQTINAIDDINRNMRGELRIGIGHSRGQAILPLIIPEFSRTHTMVELSIVEGSTEELEQYLERGEIDIIMGYAPFLLDTAETVELIKEHMSLLVPRELLYNQLGTEKAEEVLSEYKKKADLSLFKDLPFVLLKKGDRIRTLVDREFYLYGINPRVVTETRNIQTVFALCAEGMGLTVCPDIYLGSPYTIVGPDSYTRSKLEVLNFYDEDKYDTFAIGYNRDRYLSRVAADFIDFAVEACKVFN
ncbi:MAG: LysR family transcriptional regulator [Eubacteriales bacterium]|nr:LysR family transcriptional regulator [Eubacteriales bacterium]